MRTDPRNACANEHQRLLWAVVHDALAHPLMALTGYCAASLRFHDWTSHRAWPRQEPEPKLENMELSQIYEGMDFDRVTEIETRLRMKRMMFCTTARPRYIRGFWKTNYLIQVIN